MPHTNRVYAWMAKLSKKNPDLHHSYIKWNITFCGSYYTMYPPTLHFLQPLMCTRRWSSGGLGDTRNELKRSYWGRSMSIFLGRNSRLRRRNAGAFSGFKLYHYPHYCYYCNFSLSLKLTFSCASVALLRDELFTKKYNDKVSQSKLQRELADKYIKNILVQL